MSDDVQNRESAGPSAPPWKSVFKAAVLLAALVGALALVYFSPLRESLTHVREISERIRQAGVWGPVVFTLGAATLVAAGIPRLLLCPIAGMALGFWAGLLWCQVGTLLGYYLVFLFVRWGGRGFVLRHWPGLTRWGGLAQRQGAPAVILARLLPIHGMGVTLLLGLSSVRHRHFLAGTFIGSLPEAIPCTLIGSGFGGLTAGGALQTSFARSAGVITLAVLILAVIWIGLGLFARRSRNLDHPAS